MSYKISWTKIDEAPLLASYCLLPILKSYTRGTGIEFEIKDISLAGRIIENFPENLTEGQKIPDYLSEVGQLTQDPNANITKLPNISASIPQLKAAIKELQGGPVADGVLGPTDCKLSDQSYADGFVLARVNANTNVRIDLVSSAFDAYLFLFEETATDLVELAKDDDGGGGNNARIQWTLLPGLTYHIVANSFDPGATGAYTLSVTQTAIMGAAADAEPSAVRSAKPPVGAKFASRRPGIQRIH